VATVEQELVLVMNNLKDWMATKRVPTPGALLPALSEIRSEPFGRYEKLTMMMAG